MTPREKFHQIRARLGLDPPDVRSGGTVLAPQVREVADALGVPWAGSLQKTWLALIDAVGGIPDPETDISSPGSGTVEEIGFAKVLAGLDGLSDAPLPEMVAARSATRATPDSEETGRRRVLQEVTRRQGQPAFRSRLIIAYAGRCCMTRVADSLALEAAHILQYDGPATNRVSNGLLLRADLHSLFDRLQISIDNQYRVQVGPGLQDPAYRGLHGVRILLPAASQDHPDPVALARHREMAEAA